MDYMPVGMRKAWTPIEFLLIWVLVLIMAFVVLVAQVIMWVRTRFGWAGGR